MTKLICNAKKQKSPAFAGLLFALLLLAGCQSPKNPDEVTLAFWHAMAANDLETAKSFVSQDSQQLQAPDPKWLNATFSIGQIVINDTHARVETQATLTDKTQSVFATFLVKEDNQWRVDYPRTQFSLSGDIFNGLFESLKNIGDNLNKQLEEQMPLFEKQMESFGEELKKQLDQLGKELEKSLQQDKPSKKPSPYEDSI